MGSPIIQMSFCMDIVAILFCFETSILPHKKVRKPDKPDLRTVLVQLTLYYLL